MTKQPKITHKTLADYSEDSRNANQGTPRGLGVIEDSLNYSGAGRSLVADKHGVLIAGNKTSLAAASAGIENVIEIETDGDAIIVHKRRDLDLSIDARAKALAVADNRASELSLTWDDTQLAELLSEIRSEDADLLKAAGFYQNEFEDLLKSVGDELMSAPEDFKSYDENIDTEHQCPKCGYVWSGKQN